MLKEQLKDFYEGKNYTSYEIFGSFYSKQSTTFRIHAPYADKVYVIGDFNNFTETDELNKIDNETFEITIPKVKLGDYYKYVIYNNGRKLIKADPYGRQFELKPGFASRVTKSNFKFSDKVFINNRNKNFNKPMNIYELHLGSFMHLIDEEKTYKNLAPHIIKYLKEMNYTHVEFMPLTEYPFCGSWGYQAYGYFAPTSRYGDLDGLKYLVNELHKAKIGVFLDFVLAHFVKDDYGLSSFSGMPQYEYYDIFDANSEWDTLYFDLGRGNVISFLISSINYFINEFHFDGIRIDAVSNILYYHGSKEKGENKTGVDFIKRMNHVIKELHNDSIIMMAEDSSDFYKVTGALEEAGLGFDYKWCLGWMNDTLKYLEMDPIYRTHHHNLLTFSMMYNYNEKYILPLSHDEVVHGKKSIVSKMWGTLDMQIAQAKALYVFMYSHPGHILNFMGNELGQIIEFDEKREIDWLLLEYERHSKFHEFIKDLNKIYLDYKELSSMHFDPLTFSYINADKNNDNIYLYRRTSNRNDILIVLNFSNNYYENYKVGVYSENDYLEIINTDNLKYGGYGVYNGTKKTAKENSDNLENSIYLNIAPFSGIIFLSKLK